MVLLRTSKPIYNLAKVTMGESVAGLRYYMVSAWQKDNEKLSLSFSLVLGMGHTERVFDGKGGGPRLPYLLSGLDVSDGTQ